jgi:KUP system potassium uptake protein
LTYSGQAAYISVHPEAYAYPVFYTAPKGTLIPTMILAVLAAVVASQAIITATFQLIAQITKLSYFPSIKIVHTSKVFHNQLYVPLANWLLMIGTVIVTAVYNNTTSLGNAYGVCVIMVTFFDTCMVTLVALIVWLLPWYVVVFPAVTIATLDGAFLSAAMTKVPLGAWFTLTLAAVLAIFFIIWRFGKEQQWTAEAADRAPLDRFALADGEGTYRLTRHDNEPVSTNRGFGIFFDKIGDGSTPMVFSQFLEKLVTRPETTVFLHLRAVERPTISDDERFFVYDLPWPNCYRLMIRYGYMDEVITPDLASIVLEQIRQHVIERNATRYHNHAHRVGVRHEISEIQPVDPTIKNSTTVSAESDTASALASIDAAYAHRIVYVIGKEEMNIRKASPYWRSFLLSIFLFVRHNTRSKMANLKVPIDKLVEIGFVKDI